MRSSIEAAEESGMRSANIVFEVVESDLDREPRPSARNLQLLPKQASASPSTTLDARAPTRLKWSRSPARLHQARQEPDPECRPHDVPAGHHPQARRPGRTPRRHRHCRGSRTAAARPIIFCCSASGTCRAIFSAAPRLKSALSVRLPVRNPLSPAPSPCLHE